MVAANYFLATALPPLDEPGTVPPISLSELRASTIDSGAALLVDVILLGDDLRQRQAFLAGELADVKPAVLAADQITGRAPLPAVLAVNHPVESGPFSEDSVWQSYWHYAAEVARQRRSAFLRAWIGMEVALRNAIAAARARSFGQSAAVHTVAPDLAEGARRVELGVAAWASATDPLVGLRSLLRTRWEWIAENEPCFSFDDDELAAYALKLVLLHDWRRTMGAVV